MTAFYCCFGLKLRTLVYINHLFCRLDMTTGDIFDNFTRTLIFISFFMA